MAKKPGRIAPAPGAPLANDDIGEAKRREMHRLQVAIREAEQRKVVNVPTSTLSAPGWSSQRATRPAILCGCAPANM